MFTNTGAVGRFENPGGLGVSNVVGMIPPVEKGLNWGTAAPLPLQCLVRPCLQIYIFSRFNFGFKLKAEKKLDFSRQVMLDID